MSSQPSSKKGKAGLGNCLRQNLTQRGSVQDRRSLRAIGQFLSINVFSEIAQNGIPSGDRDHVSADVRSFDWRSGMIPKTRRSGGGTAAAATFPWRTRS